MPPNYIKSANVFSNLPKNFIPNSNPTIAKIIDIPTANKLSSLFCNIHHLNPSITPTKGLNEYNN